MDARTLPPVSAERLVQDARDELREAIRYMVPSDNPQIVSKVVRAEKLLALLDPHTMPQPVVGGGF